MKELVVLEDPGGLTLDLDLVALVEVFPGVANPETLETLDRLLPRPFTVGEVEVVVGLEDKRIGMVEMAEKEGSRMVGLVGTSRVQTPERLEATEDPGTLAPRALTEGLRLTRVNGGFREPEHPRVDAEEEEGEGEGGKVVADKGVPFVPTVPVLEAEAEAEVGRVGTVDTGGTTVGARPAFTSPRALRPAISSTVTLWRGASARVARVGTVARADQEGLVARVVLGVTK